MSGNHTFAAALRRHRLRLAWSQEDLAAASGVAARTISDLERGVARQPRAATVRLLAAALGLVGPELAAFKAAARPAAIAPPAPIAPAESSRARSARCRRPAAARRRARAVPWCT
jgi:transcriptional regulator with XRE-family HTH domain